MTTTTLISLPATPEEFLATNPDAIRDMYDACGGPDSYSPPPVFLPNLAALLARLGGPDAVPLYDDRPRRRAGWDPFDPSRDESAMPSAMLRERGDGDVVATLYRSRREIEVFDWHPEAPELMVALLLPADWAASAWRVRSVCDHRDEGGYSHTVACDTLAARALDHWIGEKGDPKGTFFQILSETIRP
jgi:hypothetical protein